MVTTTHQRIIFVLLGLQASVLVAGKPRPSWMKDTLTSHFSQARHHVSNPEYKMAAKNFIQAQFLSMRLTTVTHTFVSDQSDVRGMNVIGVLKGEHFNTQNDSLVAISAHYDTMRNTPGVNDNGAAVVIMLEAARELAAKKPRTSTVLFIAFDLEEWEMANESQVACGEASFPCGSRQLVKDWLPNYFKDWPLTWKGLANMDCVLNFDDEENSQHFPDAIKQVFPNQTASIRSDQNEGDFLSVAGRAPEDVQVLKDFGTSWARQGLPDFEIEEFPIPTHLLSMVKDFSRSDHLPFWEENLSALFLTDTTNYRGYMQKCYHALCDNLEFVTEDRLEFAAKISEALISWVDLRAPVAGTSAAALLSSSWLSTAVAAFCVIMTSQCVFRHRIG